MTTAALDPKLKTAWTMAAIVAAMIGLGFASVPLYRLFCQVTGFGGTTMVSTAAPGAVAGKTIVVRFDANRAPSIPWSFKPEQVDATVPLGGRSIAFYEARNLGATPVTGTATFNVTPVAAGKYFNKIQCFCFNRQTLAPGQSIRMPVTYYVDPKIADDPDARDIEEITLSYTFYPVDERAPAG